MTDHNVHLLAIVRIKIPNVQASTAQAAIDPAVERIEGEINDIFHRAGEASGYDIEFTNEYIGFAVDKLWNGKVMYDELTWFDEHGKPVAAT